MNSVEGFLDLVKKDKGLQELVSEVDGKLGKTGNDEEIIENEIIPVARERGFSFTAKEFLDYINTASKNSSSDNSDVKKSGSGNGKKIMAIVLGGATLGGGGMFAFKQMQNMNKPQAAQVQSIENDANDANNDNTVNAQGAETAVANDGLRPEENKQEDGQHSNKTSDNLKDTLNRAPSKNQQNENAGKKEAAPAQSKDSAVPNLNQQPSVPKVTKEQVDEVNRFLDALINNKDGLLDKVFSNAEKAGQKVTDEQKNQMLDTLRKLRNEATDEEKVMFMEMMETQARALAGGGAKGQAPGK